MSLLSALGLAASFSACSVAALLSPPPLEADGDVVASSLDPLAPSPWSADVGLLVWDEAPLSGEVLLDRRAMEGVERTKAVRVVTSLNIVSEYEAVRDWREWTSERDECVHDAAPTRQKLEPS